MVELLMLCSYIMGYIAVAALTSSVAQQVLERRCKEEYHWRYMEYDAIRMACPDYHWGEAVGYGVFWPVVIPYVTFYMIGTYVGNPQWRKAHRQRMALREAENKLRVAKLNAEAIAIAERSVHLTSDNS